MKKNYEIKYRIFDFDKKSNSYCFNGGLIMGIPEWHYRVALQCLAYSLTYDTNHKLAKEIEQEKDINKLEEYIKNKRQECSPYEFYYYAGIAIQQAINDASENYGTDGLNASIASLVMFEDFIELNTAWIPVDEINYKCAVCGFELIENHLNFCPNCGRKVKKEDE